MLPKNKQEWAIFSLIVLITVGAITAVNCWPQPKHAARTVCVREVPECGKPPEKPPAAQQRNAEGAQEFVRHHYDVLNYTQRTGDPEPLRELYDRSCRRCGAIVDNAEELAADERWIEGGHYTVTEVGAVTLAGRKADLEVALQRAAATLHGPDGQVLFEPDADFVAESEKPAVRHITLIWTDGGWRITSLEEAHPYRSKEA